MSTVADNVPIICQIFLQNTFFIPKQKIPLLLSKKRLGCQICFVYFLMAGEGGEMSWMMAIIWWWWSWPDKTRLVCQHESPVNTLNKSDRDLPSQNWFVSVKRNWCGNIIELELEWVLCNIHNLYIEEDNSGISYPATNTLQVLGGDLSWLPDGEGRRKGR